MPQKPLRLALAQRICRPLPPLIAQRIRSIIYPWKKARVDAHEFEFRSQTGSLFKGRTSNFHAYPFSACGYYDWRNWAIALAVSSRGDRIIELGANVGTETVAFADIVGKTGRVFAFEPFPENIKWIQLNVERNALTQVMIYPLAVGKENGQVKFIPPLGEYESGAGYVSPSQPISNSQSLEVQCITLDSLYEELGHCTALFMDVEGAEADVLRGGKKYISAFHPVIVLEATPSLQERSGYSLETLFNEIRELGYTVYRVGRWKLTDIDLSTKRGGNWVCVPQARLGLLNAINRKLILCGLLPCIPGLNPLTKRTLAS